MKFVNINESIFAWNNKTFESGEFEANGGAIHVNYSHISMQIASLKTTLHSMVVQCLHWKVPLQSLTAVLLPIK